MRGTFWKSLCPALENVTNCPSALRFVPPSCLRKQNLAGKLANFNYIPSQPLYRDLAYVQVSVLPLDSSSVFCSCSLTHTATACILALYYTDPLFCILEEALDIRIFINGMPQECHFGIQTTFSLPVTQPLTPIDLYTALFGIQFGIEQMYK